MARIDRTTRRHTLTEIGKAYLERCRDVLASVQAAEHVTELLQPEPFGELRVTAPVTWGVHSRVPVVGEYLAAYPKVHLELNLSDRVADLGEEGFHCAVRSGRLTDTRLVARPLKRSRLLAVASPAYLAQHGHPRHPSELESHALLIFTGWRGPLEWRFTRAGETVHVPLRGPLGVNNGQALLNAALAGIGVVAQHGELLARSLEAGALVHLLRIGRCRRARFISCGWRMRGRVRRCRRLSTS